ncbi:CS domain [Carpediemonas membranifera]|uniref:CS domain n=1 Tax=Carpediemonas membranifera TaxID=201153 RepID=A0A8J6E1B2_9EUKA|nr:CS domain [Carpediemonas membranifera]|eukprot:KAG9390412.1 CS domain [Carpediemonas membranifera]
MHYCDITWAQDETRLFVTINAPGFENIRKGLSLTKDTLKFDAKNAKGEEYAIELKFLDPVNPDALVKYLPLNCFMIIEKASPGWWPKLQEGPKSQHIKIDWSRWRDEDDEEEHDPMANLDMSQFESMAQAGGVDMPEFDAGSDEEEDGDEDVTGDGLEEMD